MGWKVTSHATFLKRWTLASDGRRLFRDDIHVNFTSVTNMNT